MRRSLRFFAVLVALASFALPGPRAQSSATMGAWSGAAQESRGPGVPDDRTLESSGAVVGTITIRAASIFDTDDPKEDRALFRGANRLHITTREGVIRRQLTFAEGDRYTRAALDESERLLRHNGYLYDATIKPVRYEGDQVDVEVRTRDVWTLRPAVGYRRSGGVNTTHFGLHDANFLGLGKSVQVERLSGVDRTQTEVSYTDPALAGTHTRMALAYSSNSDGAGAIFTLERPFWRRDERWALGLHATTDDRTDSLYALGSITDQFRERSTFVEGYYGLRLADTSPATRRLLFGLTFDRSTFEPLAATGVGTALPSDRLLTYPWVGVTLLRDDYVRARDMDKLGRTEDVNLGREFTARLGFAAPAFGADRSAGIVDLSWTSGYSPGTAQIVSLLASANGRVTAHGVEDGRVTAAARYYHRDNDVRLFFMSFTAAAATRLDADHQLLLGGDNGLRGYPLRYALGDKSLRLTLEERFYFDREFFHLMRLGAAVFADVGKAWGETANPAAHLGVLKDFGIGLRFGQTRSAHAGMLRIDLAVPIDAMHRGFHPQVVVSTGETF
jgi:hypothetical protein